VGVVLQHPVSFSGDSECAAINYLELLPTVTFNFKSGWFGGYGDFEWQFDWNSNDAATIPLSVQAGKVSLAGQAGLSVSMEGVWYPVHPSNVPYAVWGARVNAILFFPGMMAGGNKRKDAAVPHGSSGRVDLPAPAL
jgi:hypothetical protein